MDKQPLPVNLVELLGELSDVSERTEFLINYLLSVYKYVPYEVINSVATLVLEEEITLAAAYDFLISADGYTTKRPDNDIFSIAGRLGIESLVKFAADGSWQQNNIVQQLSVSIDDEEVPDFDFEDSEAIEIIQQTHELAHRILGVLVGIFQPVNKKVPLNTIMEKLYQKLGHSEIFRRNFPVAPWEGKTRFVAIATRLLKSLALFNDPTVTYVVHEPMYKHYIDVYLKAAYENGHYELVVKYCNPMYNIYVTDNDLVYYIGLAYVQYQTDAMEYLLAAYEDPDIYEVMADLLDTDYIQQYLQNHFGDYPGFRDIGERRRLFNVEVLRLILPQLLSQQGSIDKVRQLFKRPELQQVVSEFAAGGTQKMIFAAEK